MTARSDFELINPPGMFITPSYHHALKVGRTVYVAGQVARDEDRNLVGRGDAEVQARTVYEHLSRVLAAAGATFNDVVKINTYLSSPEHSAAVSKVRFEYFGDYRPPHTGLIVGFGDPGVCLEVEVIAVLPA